MNILEKTNEQNRIKWIDCLKFIAIFFIYIGHFCNAAGKFYNFVFVFHVPLFFICSGFFAKNNEKLTLYQFIIKTFKRLVVPFLGFSVLSTTFFALYNNFSLIETFNCFITNILGIRNTIIGESGIWFIICLFWIILIYELFNRIFKKVKHKEYIILALSLVLMLLINYFVKIPIVPFNLDSAVYYMFYYSFGNVLISIINNIKKYKNKISIKCVLLLVFVWTFYVTIMVFFNKTEAIFNLSQLSYIFREIVSIFQILSICLFFIYISHLLCKIDLLCNIGKQTLVLCGTEQMFKIIYCFIVQQLNLWQENMIIIIFHTMCILVLSYFTLCKFINKYIPSLTGKGFNIKKIK